MSVLHKLSEQDKQSIFEFSTWTETENTILHKSWFSDKAYFYLDWMVNKENVHFG